MGEHVPRQLGSPAARRRCSPCQESLATELRFDSNMAHAADHLTPDVLRPDLKGWNFAKRERELFDSAKVKIPTWRTANQARKHLAAVISELSLGMPTPNCELFSELDASTANRSACISLGAVVVRSTSSIMSLVGCGHEREALGLARTSLEALIRARQVVDDPSGDVARKLLEGRRAGSLKSAALRYGDKRDIELLDRFAHADLLSLLVVSTRRPNGVEADLQLLPQRGGVGPANQLLTAAHKATMFSVVLAEAFSVTVEIRGFLSSQLKHYKDNPLPDLL